MKYFFMEFKQMEIPDLDFIKISFDNSNQAVFVR